MADNPTYQLGLEGQDINAILSRASIGGAIDQSISNVEKANTLYTFYRDSNAVVVNPHTSSDDGFTSGDDAMSVKCNFNGYIYIQTSAYGTPSNNYVTLSYVLSKKSVGGSYSSIDSKTGMQNNTGGNSITESNILCVAVSSGDVIKVEYTAMSGTISKIKLFCMKIG